MSSFLSVMATYSVLKMALHPALNSWPIDGREICVSPGTRWAVPVEVGI